MYMYKSPKLVVDGRMVTGTEESIFPHTGIQLRSLPRVSMLLILEVKSHHYYICILLIIN